MIVLYSTCVVDVSCETLKTFVRRVVRDELHSRDPKTYSAAKSETHDEVAVLVAYVQTSIAPEVMATGSADVLMRKGKIGALPLVKAGLLCVERLRREEEARRVLGESKPADLEAAPWQTDAAPERIAEVLFRQREVRDFMRDFTCIGQWNLFYPCFGIAGATLLHGSGGVWVRMWEEARARAEGGGDFGPEGIEVDGGGHTAEGATGALQGHIERKTRLLQKWVGGRGK